MSDIAIIGAGAWGTALSIVLGRKETHRVRLWAHEKEVCESIAQRHVNEKFLPGQTIPACVTPCAKPRSVGRIQRASERALKHGTCLAQVLTLAADVRQHAQSTGLVVFSYLNPILRMGIEKFCTIARHAGVDGVLVTDLPVEEAKEYLQAMKAHDLAPVFLAAPTSPDERLRQIAQASRGFVYAVSRTGVTGARQQLAEDAQKLVRRLRRVTKLPIAVGFGIASAEQFAEVGRFADAVVVGSAIVETIESHRGREAEAVGKFVRKLVAG